MASSAPVPRSNREGRPPAPGSGRGLSPPTPPAGLGPQSVPPPARVSGASRLVLWTLLALVLLAAGALAFALFTYPSDRTPEGAYYRVVIAVNNGRARDFFAYVETAAQHASYTIGDYRKRARRRVLADYPEPERTRLSKTFEAEALAPDGSDVFALYAARRGWVNRLRRDLSGVARVEVRGDRATVVTARGTRYPFRRRENGIWGLTLFTAELSAEAERAARDMTLIDKAAADYARVRKAEAPAR
ncbi:MAG TPA: hypothetical protein VGP93_05040 [Polyangiaceae bacterium]|nr:hypothetical protein [Polyangiaceae bacterium]